MTTSTPPSRGGAPAALAAYLMWGVFGLYFKALAAVPAPEILAHRVLGGALFALLLLAVRGQAGAALRVFRNGRLVAGLGASALAIAVNWGVFIWAVAAGRALEASLGYFLFPLVSVVLARLFLGERLTRRQQAAAAVVAAAVAWLVVQGHGLPWVALVLAVSFGAYGLLRKTLPVDSLAGLFVETVLLAPLAAGWLVAVGGGTATAIGGAIPWLLALAGPVTAIPLVLFAYGARRMRLSTLGLMMYVNPTVQMLVAVFVFGEPFTATHGVAFAGIWVGLALYSWPAARRT
ncbi:MAG: EamA family transporter RarD [Solirubrobacterales bacterium]